MTQKPIFHPPPSLAAVTGGGVQGGAARPAVPGGGGGNPTSMAQNDTHVALIILNTQMWGGGNYWWKKLFRAKICVPVPSAPTSVLTQNKGPDREPLFSNTPPLLRRASMSPSPPRRSIFRSPCYRRGEGVGVGMAAGSPPPDPPTPTTHINEVYQRGPKLKVDFRYTNFCFGLRHSPPKPWPAQNFLESNKRQSKTTMEEAILHADTIPLSVLCLCSC